MSASLHDRIGGDAAVMAAVDLQREVEFFVGRSPVERELALRSLRVVTAARSG